MANMNIIINEIKGLDEYIRAMSKVYTTPQLSGDFENLLLHVNRLKAWAGLNDEMSTGNCNIPHVSVSCLFTDY